VSANNSRKDYLQCAKEIHKPNYENCLTRRSAGAGVARCGDYGADSAN
jgi:hypothetical protein